MAKTSICGRRLSLTLKGVGAIAFLAVGILPGRAAELQRFTLKSSARPGIKQLAPSEGTADDLKLSPASHIQDSDLSELPVLESPVPLGQPVSVPPITSLEVSVPPRAVESTQPTEVVVTQVQNEPDIPLEPPFIGDFAQPTVPEISASTETLVSGSPLPASSATVEPATTNSAAIDLDSATTDSTTTDSTAASTQTIRRANVSRWPAPIPFGQPLPDDQRY